MGGNKSDRKSYKATSSAKAAEALAAKGGGATGFGGFSGLRPVAGFGFGAPAAAAGAAAGSGSADPLELSAQLDGDFAQCLRHMSKRDTTTKMKALQNLKELIPDKTPADLALLLPPWVYQFKKLLLDPSKSVRAEAASIMSAVGSAVGKALLPQLKGLLGPWYLACFDPYPDAAAAAKRSLQEVFPGQKQTDALVYCRCEVLSHIITCLAATPQSLGDTRKDTPEELEDRYERVIAASLAAAAALLSAVQELVQQQQQNSSRQQLAATAAADPSPAATALSEVQDKLQEVLAAPGFFKKYLGSKSPVIRRSSYGLVKCLSAVAPQLLQSCVAAAAPVVLGALQEKEASNHPAMWEMLLAYIQSQRPGCWEHINMQKAFTPRLLALLRHACYGSAATSLPALLPLIALLPRQLQGFQALLLLDSVLEALWTGLQQCMGNQASRAATAAAYQEVLGWGLRNAAALGTAASYAHADCDAATANRGAAGTDALNTACKQLLVKGHVSSLVDCAFGGAGADAQLAASCVQEVLLAQCVAASTATQSVPSDCDQKVLPVQLQVLLSVICAAAQTHLVAAAAAHHPTAAEASSDFTAAAGDSSSGGVVFSRLQQLLNALSSSTASSSQLAAAQLASSCCAGLLPLLQAGQQLPAVASQLVARVIREYPAAAGATAVAGSTTDAATAADTNAAGNSSVAALVQLGISKCGANTQLSSADLELLLSCIAGCDNPADAWSSVFSMAAAAAGAAGDSSIATWRFLDLLLRSFASSGNLAGAAEAGWSHPQLDSIVLQLLQQLVHASSGGRSSSNSWASAKVQAASASFLGCCLGANEQQIVLLSSDAVESALADVVSCISAAQQGQKDPGSALAAADAAAVCVAALHMALEASSHGSASSSSDSSLLTLQPQQVAQLLIQLVQLSWGGDHELVLPTLGQGDAESSDDQDGSTARSSSNSTSSDSVTDEGLDDPSSEMEAQELAEGDSSAGPGGEQQAAAAAVGSSRNAWTALQRAAARMWDAGLLSLALDELPSGAGGRVIRQLQLLLVRGVEAAAEAARAKLADINVTSCSFASAVEAGLRWGSRAAVVLTCLDGRQDQQQELVQQIYGAAGNLRHWCETGSSTEATNSTVSTQCASSAQGDAVTAFRVMLSSVLVLQVGCNVLLPLASSPSSTEDCGSISSSRCSRQRWLLLELLCTCSGMNSGQFTPCSSSSAPVRQAVEKLTHCVPAAASSAQQFLLDIASKSSSRGAAARAVLADTLSTLLSATQTAADANPVATATSSSTTCRVYCSTLVSLLQHVVERLNTRPASLQQLLPVLQEFSRHQVAAAASAYVQAPQAGAASGCSTPSWVLVSVLEVLARAFRFIDEPCIVESGLSQLSVGLVNRATALAPAALQDSSVSKSQPQIELLQLAIACFTVQYDHSQHDPRLAQHQQKHHPHAAAKALQLSVGSSTAVERQALAALLRHSCSGNTTSSTFASSTAELLCRLQLCCVGYCWSDMSAPEWHIVLRDLQARLSATRREFEKAANSLAGAVCTAAQQLTAAIASDSVMTPAVAIEVLRKLSRKGLLQRQASISKHLADAATEAMASLSSPTLQLGLQLLAAVLQLQQQIQAAGRAPQLDLSLAAAWRELLSLLLALGASLAVASSCGPSVSTVLVQCLEGQGDTWLLLHRCCSAGLCQQDAVGKVLAAADERAEMLGVDAVSCCLALLQAPLGQHHHHQQQQQQQQCSFCDASAVHVVASRHACEPLQQMAWELLLHPASLSSITHAAAAASKADDKPEYGANDDAATFLVAVGLRPEMAAALTNPKPWQVHLLHWALLLAHIAQLSSLKSSLAQRSLTQALRDVPDLVPELLERVVALMGLGGSKKGVSSAAAVDHTAPVDDAGSGAGPTSVAGAPAGSKAGLSLSAQVQLSAKLQQLGTGSAASALAGDVWLFSSALRNIGLPLSHSSWRWLAAAVYRAVLQQLPASARLWFSDLRDRARIAAVETYTTKFESPALLAAEFAAIKRDAGGASGEVGGSCNFKVRASPAAREVTAVLEIEDGATLELQVKLPAAAPLKAAEVECRNKVGIKDGRLRKWLLSIAVFLRNQNQGILDAISMWKSNLDQEFAGVEPCLVCMCVISTVNGQLPRLSCRHCHVSFHPACLYRWFRSSGKSNCVHCQNPW